MREIFDPSIIPADGLIQFLTKVGPGTSAVLKLYGVRTGVFFFLKDLINKRDSLNVSVGISNGPLTNTRNTRLTQFTGEYEIIMGIFSIGTFSVFF